MRKRRKIRSGAIIYVLTGELQNLYTKRYCIGQVTEEVGLFVSENPL